MKAKGTLKEYTVIGRKLPTETEPVTPLYRCVNYSSTRGKGWGPLTGVMRGEETCFPDGVAGNTL